MNSLSWPLEGELLPFVAHTIALKSDLSYWKDLHARAIGREKGLKKQLKHKLAYIQGLKRV